MKSKTNLTDKTNFEHKLKIVKDELQAIFDGIEGGISTIDKDYLG